MKYADDYYATLFEWRAMGGDVSVYVDQWGNRPVTAKVLADGGYAGESLVMSAEECEEFAAKMLEAARAIRGQS